MNLLLLSTSTLYGQNRLEYALDPIKEWLGGSKTLTFIGYALHEVDSYTDATRNALKPLGITVKGLHAEDDQKSALRNSEHVFVGGGNTFRLLKTLQEKGLLDIIRQGVLEETTSYMGASAGTNLACPTIRTTNDMPIVEPPTLDALGLIRFQITRWPATGRRQWRNTSNDIVSRYSGIAMTVRSGTFSSTREAYRP